MCKQIGHMHSIHVSVPPHMQRTCNMHMSVPPSCEYHVGSIRSHAAYMCTCVCTSVMFSKFHIRTVLSLEQDMTEGDQE